MTLGLVEWWTVKRNTTLSCLLWRSKSLRPLWLPGNRSRRKEVMEQSHIALLDIAPGPKTIVLTFTIAFYLTFTPPGISHY